MNFIFDLLGIGGGDGVMNDLPNMIGGTFKWIFRCGCMLVIFLVGAIALALMGAFGHIKISITQVIVVMTMIVALLSLIRSSLGY